MESRLVANRPKTERNARMETMHHHGVSMAQIARDFSLSNERVR